MKRTPLLILSFFVCAMAHSQLAVLNNKGALIHANPNSLIKVKGSFLNDDGSIFRNHGTTIIDSSFINNELSEGNGIYAVGLHWENNGTFIPDTSHTYLVGDNQLITGDSITHFYNLDLEGTGIKRQTIDAYTENKLRLNDRELATDSSNMTINSPFTNAISRTVGFVSSLANGKLIRHTNTVADYLYPTGSSIGVVRYRPVIIRPNNIPDAYYGVRMVNNDPTLDSYNVALKDSDVCEVNPVFYHRISRILGSINATMAIHYDPAVDGNWDGLANWDQVSSFQWEDMGPVGSGTNVPFNYNKSQVWTQWQFENYALSKRRPSIPLILGDTLVCGGYTSVYDGNSPETNTTYTWNLTNGGTLSDTTADPVFIQWGSGSTTDTLQLVQTSQNGCSSYPATIIIQVSPEPVAQFSASPLTGLGTVPVQFTDNSTNAVTWNWNFGDGSTSGDVNPGHIFNQQGTYTATLIIESAEGCFDTATVEVNIIDGLVIPNVFTPNGDGDNDLFEISGTNFKNFEAYIYDRWGLEVFSSNAAQISWNGITYTGSTATDGTYFLVLKITLLNDEVVNYSGSVTLYH